MGFWSNLFGGPRKPRTKLESLLSKVSLEGADEMLRVKKRRESAICLFLLYCSNAFSQSLLRDFEERGVSSSPTGNPAGLNYDIVALEHLLASYSFVIAQIMEFAPQNIGDVTAAFELMLLLVTDESSVEFTPSVQSSRRQSYSSCGHRELVEEFELNLSSSLAGKSLAPSGSIPLFLAVPPLNSFETGLVIKTRCTSWGIATLPTYAEAIMAMPRPR